MPFRFEKLDVWKRAREYATTVYQLTSRFPDRERYGLTSQMNRAANSVSLNIAEGSARKTAKAFCAHIDIAIGSTAEVIAASYLALDQQYITVEQHRALYIQGEVLGKSLNALFKLLHARG